VRGAHARALVVKLQPTQRSADPTVDCLCWRCWLRNVYDRAENDIGPAGVASVTDALKRNTALSELHLLGARRVTCCRSPFEPLAFGLGAGPAIPGANAAFAKLLKFNVCSADAEFDRRWGAASGDGALLPAAARARRGSLGIDVPGGEGARGGRARCHLGMALRACAALGSRARCRAASSIEMFSF
jgi:hypothetical protein